MYEESDAFREIKVSLYLVARHTGSHSYCLLKKVLAFPVLKGLPELLVSADISLYLKKCNPRADFCTEGSVKVIQVFPK